MTNPFRDQEKFMRACDQTVDAYSISQYKMYLNLIAEEYQELKEAVDADNLTEQLDALIDIDRETGKVRKREDGKVLKPVGWMPPELAPFVSK